MKTVHQIIQGDSRGMRLIPDESAHLVVTSPPYWHLKDYGVRAQIGYHDTYEDYINDLNAVWQECHRALHPGCRLCVNIGDQYARAAHYGRYKVIPIRTEIIKFCEVCGFDYMGAIIWQKNATMNTSGGGSVMGSFPYPRNGILKLDYEFILIFKKLGTAPRPDPQAKEASALTKEEWKRYFCGHWHFAGARQDKHLAMFPPELPRRLIRMFSFVGDTVLDPFLGSGTTTRVAASLRRSSFGYEINPLFIERMRDELQDMVKYPEEEYQFSQDDGAFKRDVQLPYRFHDPHKLCLQVDPKKMAFGSKIGEEPEVRDEYCSVKEIISPVSMRLSIGKTIRLLGVMENILKRKQAIQFLSQMTKGQRVFIKYDDSLKSNSKDLLCYLYLKNKTFLNAKLIQAGLADVDPHLDFKYKEKFLNLQTKNGT